MARQFTCCLSLLFMALVGLNTGGATKCSDTSISECQSQDEEKLCYEPEAIIECLKNLTDCEGDDSVYREDWVLGYQQHVDHPICPGITEEGACIRKELARCEGNFSTDITQEQNWDRLCHQDHGSVKEMSKCFEDLIPKCAGFEMEDVIQDNIDYWKSTCRYSDFNPDNKHE